MDDVYFGLCSNEFLLDITYELANVFGMLGEDPGDEGYEDPYDEDGSTVQTIILPGNTDLVKKNSIFAIIVAAGFHLNKISSFVRGQPRNKIH